MSDPNLEDAGSSPETAVQQQGDRAWPIPGDEGYVHPDGTPQSIEQMASNKRAAADRAAAGSILHGAPAATPGPQLQAEAAAAARRAEADSANTTEDAKAGLADFVQEGFKRAGEKAEKSSQDVTPSAAVPDAKKRTATTEGGKTVR